MQRSSETIASLQQQLNATQADLASVVTQHEQAMLKPQQVSHGSQTTDSSDEQLQLQTQGEALCSALPPATRISKQDVAAQALPVQYLLGALCVHRKGARYCFLHGFWHLQQLFWQLLLLTNSYWAELQKEVTGMSWLWRRSSSGLK